MRPTDATDLVGLLQAQAQRHGATPMLHFLLDGEVEGPVESSSFADLDAAARRVGAALRAEGQSGRPVLLLFSPGLEFVRAFFGCLYGGAVAVPVYPPDPRRFDSSLRRLRAVVADSGARALLTDTTLLPLVRQVMEGEPLLSGMRLLASDAAPETGEGPPRIGADAVAMLQYTSGSTGTPKGVVLRHANLLANSVQIGAAFGNDDTMRLVSWLPPYHDMGLIGGILQPIHQGTPVQLMAAHHFLQRPLRWLRAVHAFRATHSGGPNFAYELLLRKVDEADKDELDLSSWTRAFNGAEPIRAQTVERFAVEFARCGFRRSSFLPCYGLAEATLMVSGGRGITTRVFDALALEGGRLEAGTPGDPVQIAVSSGTPVPGTEVAVVDPEQQLRRADGLVGELWVSGPSVAQGYQGGQGGSFDARLPGDARAWLRTGDLGGIVDGELFVTGRQKDLLVIRGRNLHPADVERVVEAAHPGIRPGNVAALTMEGEGTEGLMIAAELRTAFQGEVEELLDAVAVAVVAEHDLVADRILLLEAGALPKTPSGKLQRSAARSALARGELSVLASRGARPSPLGAVEVPIYGALPSALARLDRRRLTYRFDLEGDLPWSRIDEAGLYYGPEALRGYGYDVEALQAHPAAWALFQWRVALSIAGGFELLEQALLGFTRREATHFEGIRSIHMLEEEEEKHVALFSRYARHLAKRDPAHEPELARTLESLRAALARFADPGQFPSRAAYHYAWWLLIIFFEELTIWLAAVLEAEAPLIQPTWLVAHQLHRREEIQHVLTDVACLRAIRATEDERHAWSREVYERVALQLALAMSPDAGLQLVMRVHPELEGGRRGAAATGSPFARMLANGAFARTCAAGPYFAALAAGGSPPPPAVAADPEHTRWLEHWFARRGVAVADPDTPFPSLGLDSLGALALSGDLERRTGRRLSTAIAYDYPTVGLLAAHLTELAGQAVAEARAGEDRLLARQIRLLTLDAAHPGQVLDHITVVYELAPADPELIRRALAALVRRHPGLWSTYRQQDLWQAIPLPPHHPLPLALQALSTGVEQDSASAALAAVQDRAPFDLGTEPPWRALLLQGPEVDRLILTFHHVAVDGWSMEILWRDLSALIAQGSAVLPGPPRARPVEREARLLGSPEAAARLAWWQAQLGDHPRCRAPSRPPAMRGALARGHLETATVDSLWSLANRHDTTLFVVLLTAFHRVLRAREGSGDLLVNTHLLNRRTEEERGAVGYFVNLATIRARLAADEPFAESLARVRLAWLEALEHDLPIDHLVRSLWPDRYPQRWMPGALAFNMLVRDEPANTAPGLVRRHDLSPPPAFLFFEGMLVAAPVAEGLDLAFWYDAAAFDAGQAADLVEAFCVELARACARAPTG